MIFWSIFLFISIGLIGAGSIKTKIKSKEWYDLGISWLAVFGIVVCVFSILILIICSYNYHVQYATFEADKNYIEQHIGELHEWDKLEDTSLTTIKIEDNRWLTGEQFTFKNYVIFSFADEDIMKLEPIK